MRVRVLGSAAGGGFPQWNCNCVNCAGLRRASIRAKPRTQSSLAVSADGVQWVLLNASPDIRTQIFSFTALLSTRHVRTTAIAGVLLSDAELDHITGLLSMREAQPIKLYCTQRVFDWVFSSNPIFGALDHQDRLRITRVNEGKAEIVAGLCVEALFVRGKVPSYINSKRVDCVAGATVGYRITDVGARSTLLYVPAIKAIDDSFIGAAMKCDCLMFDGSFWSDNEMILRGAGTRTASQMGHVPISGNGGSLAHLAHLSARKIFIHINNTNPILDESSAERREVEKAGWEVAEDGLDFTL